MKQLPLIPSLAKEHGGSLSQNKRKTFKPISFKKLTHLVLKAKPSISLFKNRNIVLEILRRQEKLSAVKIYNLSIQHDHIHLAILCSGKGQYNSFIRATTGILARRFGRGLWRLRPYTKIVEWGRQTKNLNTYIKMNELEIWGVIPYQKRKY